MMETQLSNPSLHRLQSVLEAEIGLYEQAGTRLQEKQAAIITMKQDQLVNIDRELAVLQKKAAQLEASRHEVLAEMGYENGTLSQLIEKVACPEQAGILMRIRDRLHRAVDDADRQNRNSRELLNLSIHYVQDTVNTVVGLLNPEGAAYNAQGGKAQNKDTRHITAPLNSTINHSA